MSYCDGYGTANADVNVSRIHFISVLWDGHWAAVFSARTIAMICH